MQENTNYTNSIQVGDATLIHGDCIEEMQKVESESIGLSVWSPPFPELYCYSDDDRDLGNCKDYNEFKEHFSFLPPEMYRIMMQGRNVCIHCMDTPVQKGKHGYIGLRDFSGLIITEMQKAGFIYHSRITIWKNPVTEMQRTKALGLLHKQIKKDSTMSRVGIPDYVLVFRKDGDRENPVRHYGTYDEVIAACNADTSLNKNTELRKILSVDTWQQYASPVWMDIDQGDTLNGTQAREEEDEKHICPLQQPVIKRLTLLYSNEGDVCFTPFGGIGSEPYAFLRERRKAIAIELKRSYYDQMVKNCQSAVEMNKQTSLFA
jgi:DNA modification methylase